MLKTFLTAVSAVSLIGLASGASFAKTQECTCISAPSQDLTSLGHVMFTSGTVTYPGERGMVAAEPGTPIGHGTEITVGSSSKATIVAGKTCSVSVRSNSLVYVSKTADQKICVKVSEIDTSPVRSDTAVSTYNPETGWEAKDFVNFGLIGAFGVYVATLGGGGDPVSD